MLATRWGHTVGDFYFIFILRAIADNWHELTELPYVWRGNERPFAATKQNEKNTYIPDVYSSIQTY